MTTTQIIIETIVCTCAAILYILGTIFFLSGKLVTFTPDLGKKCMTAGFFGVFVGTVITLKI